MKSTWLSFLKYNKFIFGDQIVSQFVIFECKYLFSIIIFYYHKTNGRQDRYHTHAFNGFSIKLFGQYTEYLYFTTDNSESFSNRRRTEIFRYFPRDCFHKIGNSNSCATILFSGPWKDTWLERLDTGEIKKYTWGRKA